MRAIPLLALLLLTGCVHAALSTCGRHDKPMLTAELLFGRNVGVREVVSNADWARFLAEEATPRFPEGLTVVDAKGQWHDRSRGAIIRERSKMMTIVLPDDPGGRERLTALAEAYKRRLRQESVLTVLRPACVSF